MAAHAWRIFDRASQDGSILLHGDDICVYYMDKTPGPPSASKANQLIYNLKLDPMLMTGSQRKYNFKEKAIASFAEDLAGYLSRWPSVGPDNAIMVPVPPSKPGSDPRYDDRIVKVCEIVTRKTGIRHCECLQTIADLGSLHSDAMPRDVDAIRRNTYFDPSMIPPGISCILLVDDQLTKGTHFKAFQPLFMDRGYIVVGMFWAKEHSYGHA